MTLSFYIPLIIILFQRECISWNLIFVNTLCLIFILQLNSNINNLKIKFADVDWGDITIGANNDYDVYFSTKNTVIGFYIISNTDILHTQCQVGALSRRGDTYHCRIQNVVAAARTINVTIRYFYI